ncbi:hypothetical protein N0V84_010262 [Fusarium piperis]|uniref:enoyl-[acyl-carrier-protein] reductase n=1 Tax=Fusarium piperis TaxID=1435070 RepID=A0A9W8W4R9_9HYPO|nr:hypothetical protein N0V84_010262 [Fusarium piperis]
MVIITQYQPSTDLSAPIRFYYPEERENQAQSLGPDNLLVSFLISPINPQDQLVIAGRYPVKPSYTHDGEPLPGYDGVARVEAVGASSPPAATTFSPGDLIAPRRHGLGTWRSQAVFNTADVIRLSPTDNLIGASLLRLAFLPAYLLLEDVHDLKPGDWVVQNAASSTIGRLVAQFARLKGVHTCSIVRDRQDDDMRLLEGELHKEGADVVITERDLGEKGSDAHPALADASSRGRVALAIDGVFGEAGERLACLLSHGGTYVNYGSLGGADGVIRLSQRLLFWSEVRFRNFRLSEQLNRRTPAQQESLLLWFQDLLAQGLLRTPKVDKIQVPVQAGDRTEFEQLVIEAVTAGTTKKVGNVKRILDFGHPSVAA